MLARISSFGLQGIEGFPVSVEVDVSNGMPAFELVGLPDTAVKESKERVRSALRNTGLPYPTQRITVNLAPADIRKEGALYDLPIAIGLLCAMEAVPQQTCTNYSYIGELSLNGDLRPVNGILPMAIEALHHGFTHLIVPEKNVAEAAYIEGLTIYGMQSLTQCCEFLNGNLKLQPFQSETWQQDGLPDETRADFAQIVGQQGAKRAMEIAAAGGHNIMLIGPPGSGKTMLARSLNGILPELSFDEALEVTKIHSVCGSLKESGSGIMRARPFRSPHHTASAAALTGGGAKAMPGEVSLAHFGVMHLDELPEFRRDVLESLRQPLEDGRVTVTRVSATATYPAEFMLVASMNPCPCGQFGHGDCRCTAPQIQRYLNRISGPLLDRIDLHIEMGPVSYEQLTSDAKEESSAEVRARVNAARRVQMQRYREDGIYCNAQLTDKLVKQHCRLDATGKLLLQGAFNQLDLSARAYTRILKVARTIADIEGSADIQTGHVAEAVQYRSLDRKYWT